jgi:Putative auto-transporter adhesin, head GIN domain
VAIPHVYYKNSTAGEKQMRPSLIALTALALLAGCTRFSGQTGHDLKTRSYPIAGFDSVMLTGSDTVHISNGAQISVTAAGDEDVLEMLSITVEDGVLKVSRKGKDGWLWNKSEDEAVITVVVPLLHRVSVKGSGDMTVKGTASDHFSIALAGSGDIAVTGLQAAKTSVQLAGSGDVVIEGSTDQLDAGLAGSGDIRAEKLMVNNAKISLAGSGDVNARVRGAASVSLMGSGDVRITGTRNCSTSKVGSGNVTCVE